LSAGERRDRVSGVGMTSDRTRLRMIDRLRSEGIQDEVVLAAMTAVPRHLFIEEALAHRAYDFDVALPIGFEQTISQPITVARVTELARAGAPLGKVLEIGAGSGYQAAVLAHLAREVYAVERVAQLAALSRNRLVRELRLSNVRMRHADGLRGLPEAAPFDAIVISAALPYIPDELLAQLADGGRMVRPHGVPGRQQQLCVTQRSGSRFVETAHDAVRFVPALLGKTTPPSPARR
jgi:protein-L-isoaspartate(D-aspartate) O-methyltransferase